MDIGGPGLAGSAGFSSGTFTVKGGGADIWGTADQFNYASESWTGDLTITARAASQQNTSSWAKSGVMVRETTAAKSAYVFVFVTPARGVNMQYRIGKLEDAGEIFAAPNEGTLSTNDFNTWADFNGRECACQKLSPD